MSMSKTGVNFVRIPVFSGRRGGARPALDLLRGDVEPLWPVVENRPLADKRQRRVAAGEQVEALGLDRAHRGECSSAARNRTACRKERSRA